MIQPNAFHWPPIDLRRAQQAIVRAGRGILQPSHFLNSDETYAIRSWFMREGEGNSTFNSTLHRIAKES